MFAHDLHYLCTYIGAFVLLPFKTGADTTISKFTALTVLVIRVARFFAVPTIYQNGKNILNDHKIYQITTKYTKLPQNTNMWYNIPKWPENYQKTINNIYQYLPLQDPPKFPRFGIFVSKYTIWQPCDRWRCMRPIFNFFSAAPQKPECPPHKARWHHLWQFKRILTTAE
jgi:hypothetical protein